VNHAESIRDRLELEFERYVEAYVAART
jgi:hypothetical protein